MPSVFIPLNEWAPDRGLLGHDGLYEAENCVPTNGMYMPLGRPTEADILDNSEATIGGPIVGLHAHDLHDPVTFFAATVDDIFKVEISTIAKGDLNQGTTATNITGTASAIPPSAPLGFTPGMPEHTYGWMMDSFGDNVIAVHPDTLPQISTPAGDPFEVMINNGETGLKAALVTTYKQHVVLGDYELGGTRVPNGIWWSQTGNARAFGAPDTFPELIGSDNQVIQDDLGRVTQIAGTRGGLLIFRDRGISIMQGPPFSFDTISSNIGCQFPNSIAMLGDNVYFWSTSGPAVIRDGTVVVLGYSRVLDWASSLIKGNVPIDGRSKIYCGSSDPHGLIFWSLHISITKDAKNHWLIYNEREDRFSSAVNPLVNDTDPSAHCTHMASYSPRFDFPGTRNRYNLAITYNGDPSPGGSGEFIVLRMQIATGEQGEIFTDMEPVEPAKFSTAWFVPSESTRSQEVQRTTISEVRPVFGGGDINVGAGVTVTVESTSNPRVGTRESSASVQGDEGRFETDTNAHVLHRIIMTIPDGAGFDDWRDFEGFEVTFHEVAGR